MIFIDPRKGSGDLLEPIVALGLPAKHKTMEFGDIEIVGKGPEDRPVLVGVEIKKSHDLLSCIADKRFVGFQLPGLLDSFELAYLLIEGQMSASEDGSLKIWRGRWEDPPFGNWKYQAVCAWAQTIENKAREISDGAELRLAWTANRRGTVIWIASLWDWWNKGYAQHKSHRGAYFKKQKCDPVSEFRATRKMRVAMELADGVGFDRSLAASKHFRSIRKMVNADEKEWKKVKGFGPKLANQIVDEVEREEK